jgi:hypothetical protein
VIAAPATRGYAVLYRAAQLCPSCGRAHWLVGRQSAECALCGTALALAPREPDAADEVAGQA